MVGGAGGGRGRTILRLSELNRAIATALSERFPDEVWVVGEISNLRERNGTRYFDLVEPDENGRGNLAQLPAAVLRWERRSFDADLDRVDGFTLADGVEVLVRGAVDLYEPWGKLQLKVRGIDPEHTLGRLRLAREQLLAQLAERGVLRANAARRVGQPPLRVGLVTAPLSQAEHDLRAVLRTSGWAFQLVRAAARVQGPACEAEVARALAELGRLHALEPLDVVVLIRGGGSALDLQGFDTPGIAEAIIAAPFAVWTGIGHEQDRSVADEVAHTAWPTPTAVGRGLVDAVADGADRLESAAAALVAGSTGRLETAGRHLEQQAATLVAGAAAELRGADARLAGSVRGLEQLSRASLRRERRDLARRGVALARSARRAAIPAAGSGLLRFELALQRLAGSATERATRRLEVAEARLAALDPAAQLERGFSVTRDAQGRPLRSIVGVQAGAVLTTRLADGQLTSTVQQVAPDHASAPAQEATG
ncbi:MAG: exodeoxyribonuclease VII large subunit [Nitriliruptoraceae bacterium]